MIDFEAERKKNAAILLLARKHELILQLLKKVLGEELYQLTEGELAGRMTIYRQSNGVEELYFDGERILITGAPVITEKGDRGLMSLRLKIEIPYQV